MPTAVRVAIFIGALVHSVKPDRMYGGGRRTLASDTMMVHHRQVTDSSGGVQRETPTIRDTIQVDSQIMLAEYSALRAEIERRVNVQWNVFALQITSAGAIASLAIATTSNFALLLIIPLSSYMFGSRYILHDFHIKLIQQYIGESLSGRLGDNLAWDRWKGDRFSDVTDRRWFRVTGWTPLHPTRLAFEGVTALALAAALASAVYQWRVNPVAWVLILGFALMWILGASAAFVLHRAFERSSASAPAAPARGDRSDSHA